MRSLIKQVLQGIDEVQEVVVAPNGRLALDKLKQAGFDLVILDLEMPELDGIETLTQIKNQQLKVKVIVFASQTMGGAKKAMEAFKLGAYDVISKPISEELSLDKGLERIRDSIAPKIKSLIQEHRTPITEVTPIKQELEKWSKVNLHFFKPEAIVIASSTGGPNALERVLMNLELPVRVPILITQHMPPFFTSILARNLGEITKLPAEEASQGSKVQAGHIYVAPGNFHMSLVTRDNGIYIHLDQGPQIHSVRPAADKLFISAAQIYRKKCLGVVLTGMGEDGKEGAIAIKRAGGAVIIQDKDSSVVWGMPGSVHHAGAFDQELHLDHISQEIKTLAS
jgi:two-component system chemotaxis response regulator CheB